MSWDVCYLHEFHRVDEVGILQRDFLETVALDNGRPIIAHNDVEGGAIKCMCQKSVGIYDLAKALSSPTVSPGLGKT